LPAFKGLKDAETDGNQEIGKIILIMMLFGFLFSNNVSFTPTWKNFMLWIYS